MNQLSNIEIEESPITPEDNPFHEDYEDPEAHLQGIDLKLICGKWWYLAWDDWTVNVKIYAGRYWFDWDDPDSVDSITNIPIGYEPMQQLQGWEGGKIFEKKSSRDVYLPPGVWTIMFSYRDEDHEIWAKETNRAWFMSVDVPVNRYSRNRIPRTSGEGWQYTEDGIGAASITWPLRNGKDTTVYGGTVSYTHLPLQTKLLV